MKNFKSYTYLLLGIALTIMCACSEDIFPTSASEGDNVELTLSYSDVSPKEVTVDTRATEAEERKLDNLYIYIFNASGNLKGYKEITNSDDLNQNTSESNTAQITGIKTKTGASYIYAVANINTGLYPITTSNGSVEEGKLPVGLDESKAQNGEYNFTLNQLKALTFTRSANSIDISSRFLMSGAIDNGNAVEIKSDGNVALSSATTNTSTSIKLSRIVAKIRVNYRAAAGKTFTLDNYDIINIAKNGSLIGAEINNTSALRDNSIEVNDLTQRTRNVTDTYTDDSNTEWNYMEFYLPENLQTAKTQIADGTTNAWHQREADNQSTPKAFANAPEKGTYLVLHGTYSDTDNEGNKRTATVKYYIHLGDCTDNVNDYNVERNCKYTFNITVNNINEIKVEAEKQGNNEPGAEGVILSYKKTGKTCQLDAHYDYMVMRFYQNDLKKNTAQGYVYQIQDFNGQSEVMKVTSTGVEGNLNGATTSWIEFAKGGTYSDANDGKGVACAYPGKNTDGTMKNGLYTLDGFFQELVKNMNTDSFWDSGSDSNGNYIDATCFVDENYYPTHNWSEYVNGVTKRNFYVADEIYQSQDKRSVYAEAIYGLTQYNIQTFYDRSQAGSIVAYGCETINDEKRSDNFDGTKDSKGTDKWNGRSNFINELKSKSSDWSSYKSNKDLRYACMSRNRDLNGDGKITEDEVRWYTPTSAQYAGLWIGEDIVSTEAKLYKDNPSILNTKQNQGRMLYFTSTKGENAFWSEEGMATNNNQNMTLFVRCIRNLKSKDTDSSRPGYAQTPAKYYTWDSTNRYMQLDKVDEQALNTTGATGELNFHTERSTDNKPAKKFYVANENLSDNQGTYWSQITATQNNVVNGNFKCNGKYTKENKTWRVPNQRELCMMYLVAFNNEGSLTMNNMAGTYVRTYFSGATFRKSWTIDGKIMTMAVKYWDTKGKVRCVSPVK